MPPPSKEQQLLDHDVHTASISIERLVNSILDDVLLFDRLFDRPGQRRRSFSDGTYSLVVEEGPEDVEDDDELHKELLHLEQSESILSQELQLLSLESSSDGPTDISLCVQAIPMIPEVHSRKEEVEDKPECFFLCHVQWSGWWQSTNKAIL